MKYPKQIMRSSELVEMGFPYDWLRELYLRPGQRIAWKNGKGKNSPLLFDTELLERERQRAFERNRV